MISSENHWQNLGKKYDKRSSDTKDDIQIPVLFTNDKDSTSEEDALFMESLDKFEKNGKIPICLQWCHEMC